MNSGRSTIVKICRPCDTKRQISHLSISDRIGCLPMGELMNIAFAMLPSILYKEDVEGFIYTIRQLFILQVGLTHHLKYRRQFDRTIPTFKTKKNGF